MHFLVRFAQIHESFREPELEALATRENVKTEVLDYRPDSPFCILRFNLDHQANKSLAETAKSFSSRSILIRGMYELWGCGTTYETLHQDVRTRSAHLWQAYKNVSFKFSVHCFCAKRSATEQRDIIESFRYMDLKGKISMKDPEIEYVIFEEWEDTEGVPRHVPRAGEVGANGESTPRQPQRLFFVRYIGGSRRHLVEKHDLKKRPYISTTSMDAELALLTANLALAAPGKMFMDPFVGTGGFMVAAAELGALTFGSDIDGRSYRGKGAGLKTGVGANFKKYEIASQLGDCFTSDLTNTPLRSQNAGPVAVRRWLDGIISDPPYGIREGLKVLGMKRNRLVKVNGHASPVEDQEADSSTTTVQPHYIGGVLAHTLPDYIAPKKPYSFTRMLDDILDFAARTLVDGGRLAFWMPSANELDQELALPTHPLLDLKHVCIQPFNKWSRRLLVYQRVKGDWSEASVVASNGKSLGRSNVAWTANELNPFRNLYFKGFQA